MPTGKDLSLQELAAVADVTPRTIRYYIAQGLLAAPDGVGPAARYGDRHLARLRLIRQLQREHLPLAEIRARLAGLDDEAITELLAHPSATAPGSAIDYVRDLLTRSGSPSREPFDLPRPASMLEAPMQAAPTSAAPQAAAAPAAFMRPQAERSTRRGGSRDAADALAALSRPNHPAPGPDRSQWDRIALTPDVELHVRRPLGRLQNRRVDRLIVIARELLEEDPS